MRPRHPRTAARLAALALIPVLVGGAAFADTTPPAARSITSVAAETPMDAAERAAVVAALARALEDNFVFPDVARRYAAMLRANQARGAYEDLTDPDAFARRVTSDLQAVSPDRHLRLAPAAFFAARDKEMGRNSAATKLGPALETARMIGDVAYLKFNRFPADDTVGAAARAFLLAHADARAVVIDSRTNRGGDPADLDPVLPLLFGQTMTLVRMDTRAAADHGDPPGKHVERRGAPTGLVRYDHLVTPDLAEIRLQSVPVYYLVSGKTGSAAEHIAMAFKHTKRALVIGEVTAGYGHYGDIAPIGARFAAFIPVGRTYDPDTNQDWEGVGVTPDVIVPADKALDEALRRAKAAGAHPD